MAAKDYETQEILDELSTKDLFNEAIDRLDPIKQKSLIEDLAAFLRGD